MPDNEQQIAKLKKAIREEEKSSAYYRKTYGENAGGVNGYVYKQLAIIYRKQKDYKAEVAILERCSLKAGGEGCLGEDLTKRLERARELLEGQDRFGSDGKGQCQECGNKPRKLRQTKTGRWVCFTCKRILEPPRPKHLATEKAITGLRDFGFKVADDATKEQVNVTSRLHSNVYDYVRDVWNTLTGQRAPIETGKLTLFQFATAIFRDRSRRQRIVAIQQQRDTIAEGKMTEFDKASEDAWRRLRDNKPPMARDADFEFVAQQLQAHFTSFGSE